LNGQRAALFEVSRRSMFGRHLQLATEIRYTLHGLVPATSGSIIMNVNRR